MAGEMVDGGKRKLNQAVDPGRPCLVRQEPRADDELPPDAVPVGTRMLRPVPAPDSEAGQPYRFRQRHNIGFGKISGESSAVNTDICSNWLANVWPSLRAGYCDDEIYNADEAGLFFKLTRGKTLRFKGEKCSGGKLSKDRITVLVAANMTGTDKRKLLVIGKSKSPRCFKGVSSLPVFYENITKAWMTSAIFEKALNYWDDELRRKKKKILLLVDNCPAHPSLQHLKFIKLVFLPANTTAVLQPMNQSVIRNIKAHYRNQLVLKMIEDIEY
ncbi:tigger transposable element-derived protein 4-like [Rhopalosiphum padi]|uniref:tigger transposable element-derived protein 4-like n=1 Tax=Rhopalosiphum padi TaxID=40932 RepID=UPI00298D7FB5|nr:tigger transposable element-derived protein 4-like [Rhopalosiphum padi]